MQSSQIDAYLRRIGAERPTAPTATALRTLQHAHLWTVPFENLSVHFREEIVLAEDALVAKVVDARRGGFCYELNGAFGALLTALGFEVTLLQARVYGDGRPGIPYDHLTLLVESDDGERWLSDVGFGGLSDRPLAFDDRDDQADPGGTFRLAEAAGGDLDVLKDGRPAYLLDLRPRALRDFEAGAWYHRTHPASHFTRSLVCSIPTDDGRITLSGRTLTTTVGGEKHTTELADDAEVLAAYAKHFGMRLDRVPPVPHADERGPA
ncbi:arylamine N-acetyltransferase [Streptomyces sp. NPDC091292]|uniref:arylamine N-acetyltransferase family protein n=1 Tax=Streptomyces sp. NPDC091292 TaxID=3365991 RepID=UPI0037F731F7